MERIWIEKPNDHFLYGLRVDLIDEDGIHIVETDGSKRNTKKVYVYYSEFNKLIDTLLKLSSIRSEGVSLQNVGGKENDLKLKGDGKCR